MARTEVTVTEITPVKAALTTSLTGTNNDLVWTAAKGGTWGNSIQVAYIDPGGTTATLSIQVDGFVITVNLARASSAITTTGDDIKTAIAASADAIRLVTVADASSNDGSGIVTALAATALSSGSYGITEPSLTNGDSTNDHYFTGNDGKVILEVVSSDAGSQTVTIKRSPYLRTGVSVSDEVVAVAAGATMRIGPFPTAEFNQNNDGDVYFDPSVSNTLDFRAVKVSQAQ